MLRQAVQPDERSSEAAVSSYSRKGFVLTGFGGQLVKVNEKKDERQEKNKVK